MGGEEPFGGLLQLPAIDRELGISGILWENRKWVWKDRRSGRGYRSVAFHGNRVRSSFSLILIVGCVAIVRFLGYCEGGWVEFLDWGRSRSFWGSSPSYFSRKIVIRRHWAFRVFD